MKLKFTPIIIILGLTINIFSANNVIIPTPNSIKYSNSFFEFSKKIQVDISDKSLERSFKIFKNELPKIIRPTLNSKDENILKLILDNKFPDESYSLVIKKNLILITGNKVGVFYGLQSLLQMILFTDAENKIVKLPTCMVTDSPRYSWRGVMLDESRHFFGEKKVKQLLDMMAFHKLNIFHWHLTDETGWRIEIKAYPKLTEIGAIGNYSNPKAKAQFYTQKQIKNIIKYAEERCIQIIPEIDMPGHATSANKAYPQFSGGGSVKHPNYTFNPGKEQTYLYLANIIKEVSNLFPSSYIHFGGDEVHFGNAKWKTDKFIKKLMNKNQLETIKDVEYYFANRIIDTIYKNGNIAIGWDEIVDAKTDTSKSIIMWWRHDKISQLKKAFDNNYKVILCPRIPLYFDFVQDNSHKFGRRWNGFASLEQVYKFPNLKLVTENSSKIIGLQANIWTERIKTAKRLDYMTYPRISAFSESAWTLDENKNYENYILRLSKLLKYYKSKDIYYFNPFTRNKEPKE